MGTRGFDHTNLSDFDAMCFAACLPPQRKRLENGIVFRMKVLPNPNAQAAEDVPIVEATPLASSRREVSRSEVVAVRPVASTGETAAINFLRQFRVLLGAARLYQRNHPRLMEILASVEQQLRIALASQSPLVFAVERRGIIMPRYESSAGDLLRDSRGELRGLAEELLRGGICSLLFAPPVNVGELDLLAHEISRVPAQRGAGRHDFPQTVGSDGPGSGASPGSV